MREDGKEIINNGEQMVAPEDGSDVPEFAAETLNDINGIAKSAINNGEEYLDSIRSFGSGLDDGDDTSKGIKDTEQIVGDAAIQIDCLQEEAEQAIISVGEPASEMIYLTKEKASIPKAKIEGVCTEPNFPGAVVVKVEEDICGYKRSVGYAIRVNKEGKFNGNRFVYLRNGGVGPTYQLYPPNFDKLKINGIIDAYYGFFSGNNNSNNEENKEKESYNSHAEKRDFLYAKIKKKIDVILELRSFVRENEDDSYDDLKNKSEERINEIASGLIADGFISPEDKKKVLEQLPIMFELVDIKKEIIKNNKKLKSSEISESESTEGEKIGKDLRSRREAIINELGQAKDNPDLVFLRNSSFFLADVLRKKDETLKMESLWHDDPDKFLEQIKMVTDLDLRELPREKYKISFQGCTVIIRIDEEEYRKFDSDSAGVYLDNSNIVVIKNGADIGGTLNHEINHNLSESFSGNIKYVDSATFYSSYVLDSEKKEDFSVNYFEDLVVTEIQDCPFHNFAEIVADIDRIPERKITTYLSQFFKTMQRFSDISDEMNNEETAEMMRREIVKSERVFLDHIQSLSNIFFVSNALGNVDQAKGAMLLFGYKDMRMAENYLKHYFGENKYEACKKLQPFLCGGFYFDDLEKELEYDIDLKDSESTDNDSESKKGMINELRDIFKDIKKKNNVAAFFDLDNLRSLSTLLSETNINLAKFDESTIKVVSSINWLDVVDANDIGVENMSEIFKCFKNIFSSLGGSSESAPFFADRILDALTIKMTLSCLRDGNIDKLEEFYNKWPFNREIFSESVLGWFIKNRPKEGGALFACNNFSDFLEKINASDSVKEMAREINRDKSLHDGV